MEIDMNLLARKAVLIAAASTAMATGQAPAAEPENPGAAMVLLRGGSFMMGSPASEEGRGNDESRHAVTLTPFFMSSHEVTHGEYEQAMGLNPSSHRSDASLPVESVSWLDAIRYCNALSRMNGLAPAYKVENGAVSWNRGSTGYRLPTEAEWEYAARAGVASEKSPAGTTVAAASGSPNSYGLYDMEGNVAEWVFDWYAPYEPMATIDPSGPALGSLRVRRGAAWADSSSFTRPACRAAEAPGARYPDLGFRVARSAAPRRGYASTEDSLRFMLPGAPKVLVAYCSDASEEAGIAAELAGAASVEIRPAGFDFPKGSGDPKPARAIAGSIMQAPPFDALILCFRDNNGSLPADARAFTEGANLQGKLVLPLMLRKDTGSGHAASDLGKAAPGAFIGQAFTASLGRGDLRQRISLWLESQGLAVK